MTREGVYLKRAGERWSSGYLVSWSAIYLQGAKNKAAQRIAERIMEHGRASARAVEASLLLSL